MEQNIEHLTWTIDVQIKEAEFRAEFSRDELVTSLKRLLAEERKRCARLEYEYGKVKASNDIISRYKRVK
jgi:hypothetical protein